MFLEMEWEVIGLSLRVALAAVIVAFPFALFTAWLLARYRFPGRSILDALIYLPLVLPPVAIGYGLLIFFGQRGWIGEWLNQTFDVRFSFNWTGAALAASITGFPLMVRAMRLSFEAVDRRLELAARSLGASWFGSFLSVTLPLALPGIAAGVILAFARALGEFGATITFVGSIPGETETLSLAIYRHLQTPGGDTSAIRLMIVSILLSFSALILSEILIRRHRRPYDNHL